MDFSPEQIDDFNRNSFYQTMGITVEAAAAGESSALRTIYSAIERYIRDNTDQWCIFRDFWEETS